MKTVTATSVNTNIRKIKSPSKLMTAVRSAIGMRNSARSGKDNKKIGALLNISLSAALGMMSSFESNLTKSAKG